MAQARLGGKLRRLRQQHRLNQTQMAEQLGISPSYLNLLEHNQRAVTVPVLIKLAQRFDLDLQGFTADDDGRLLSDLMEMFADPLFDGHELKTTDLKDFVGGTPDLGKAMLTLYQAYRGRPAGLAAPEGEEETAPAVGMPSEEVGDFVQERKNHFKDLEAAAEALWRDAELQPDDLLRGLTGVLATRFAVDVQVMEPSAMRGLTREYDPRSRRLSLSELLPLPSRIFQLACQIALLGHRPLLEKLVSVGKFTSAEADRLALVALASYFAGAVMMPYERFREAARAARHDIELLERRFGASFEQVCHRLTTLQRPGAQGVPFHLIRVDPAGNISKRFSASGIGIARFGGACPRWNVYDAFARPGQIHAQVSRMPDGGTYFCIARTAGAVGRPNLRGNNARGVRLAIGLGCSVAYARELVYSDGLMLDDPQAIAPIGISCRVCERTDCADRALPSLHHRLEVDENRRGLSAFVLAGGKEPN